MTPQLFLLACFYFFLPAYFTNMTPPLSRRAKIFKFLDKPVDFNKKFLNEPILGSHKTWPGVILGVVVGILIAFLQLQLYKIGFIKEISFFDYFDMNIFLFGFLISTGAVFGDLLFAFLKRRLKMQPGKRFIPFDQTNYVLGAALFLIPILKLGILTWFCIFVLTLFLHIIVTKIGFWLGLNKSKW